jgi:hypothetical protein
LNDMRPYCKHQKELGWNKLAVTPVTLYHYRLNSKTLRRQESMKKSSWKMLCDGMTAALNDNQIEVAKLPYSLTLPHEISGDAALYYEPQKPLYPGMAGAGSWKARRENRGGHERSSGHPGCQGVYASVKSEHGCGAGRSESQV